VDQTSRRGGSPGRRRMLPGSTGDPGDRLWCGTSADHRGGRRGGGLVRRHGRCARLRPGGVAPRPRRDTHRGPGEADARARTGGGGRVRLYRSRDPRGDGGPSGGAGELRRRHPPYRARSGGRFRWSHARRGRLRGDPRRRSHPRPERPRTPGRLRRQLAQPGPVLVSVGGPSQRQGHSVPHRPCPGVMGGRRERPTAR